MPNSIDSSHSTNTENRGKKRRTAIPERCNTSVSLWSIMKNCIGKELSKIPMPVNFNEPISVLQRISEDLEYSHLLDLAASKSPLEQLCYVAAFAISCYSSTGNRTTKPFNPILGETYECDRRDDFGWRSVAEQVSHHPPAAAHHAEGNAWTLSQDFSLSNSTFRGKYLSVTPSGLTRIRFKGQPHLYSYSKVTTTVHNIIVGKLWIDNHGDMVIENHHTGDKCILQFHAYSYFSTERQRKVTGVVKDSHGTVKFYIQGHWDKYVEVSETKSNKSLKRLWTVLPPYPNSEKMYNFTKFAIELNEEDESVAPTDSRRRPDQRLMEQGRWDEANKLKTEIEERQRLIRKKREAERDAAIAQGLSYPEYKPKWFERTEDDLTGAYVHKFKNDYWYCKEKGDWSRSPSIF